ncbi:MAG TPA: sigma 54-interacting transcriptional regulator [Kofleriaceae bacterium]|nr:sigma 54-interacting transcriptional regulator [Kofleriaceae bacterium]
MTPVILERAGRPGTLRGRALVGHVAFALALGVAFGCAEGALNQLARRAAVRPTLWEDVWIGVVDWLPLQPLVYGGVLVTRIARDGARRHGAGELVVVLHGGDRADQDLVPRAAIRSGTPRWTRWRRVRWSRRARSSPDQPAFRTGPGARGSRCHRTANAQQFRVVESVDERWRTKTLRPASGDDGVAGAGRLYLLVLQGESSSLFALAPTGVVVIGRGPDADLRLLDETASRSHAKVITADGVARVHDLGSHNGTFVGGERVEGTRALVSGDVLTIGEMTLVLHAAPRAPEAHPVLDAATIRQRLGEELERARSYQRPLAVLDIIVPRTLPRSEAAAIVAAELREMDLVGAAGDGHLVVVQPEVGGEARALGDRLRAVVSGARLGLATYPDDGCDADTLSASARGAAAAAGPGELALAAVTVRELRIGERVLVVADPAMARLFDLIERLAVSDLPVLILGETGAGKEGAALTLHHRSRRREGPFVTLNCAAIADHLVESELFGHEKGAFTGAVASKPGKLELAHGGTVFLDEIGELPPATQSKLLRVLEDGRITRVGAVKEREVDLRIVAATNRALDDEVKAGRFRQDLFFRLGAATVVLPPLRDRPREIPILARRFLDEACTRAGRVPATLAIATLHRLAAYDWPGNVRELRNTIEYMAATVTDEVLEPWHLPDKVAGIERGTPVEAGAVQSSPGAGFRLIAEEIRELERTRMLQALEVAGGVQVRAAELIGMPLRTFVMKVKQYGISPRPRRES